MEVLTVNQIREKFLAFFEKKGHLRAPSFPLVPIDNASLLLINSGMAPLKPYFTGESTPPNVRMTTCQKCIRTPDIERVGKTSRHGTFFEMLGNFSFGDYFKEEACKLAWEFITEEIGIPKERLYISTYLDDDETWDLWTKVIGIEESHMTRLGKADNFWEIGQGPCGPCSEIYIDRGIDPKCTNENCAVGCDCDRFVEFWNLVFTQYNNDGQSNYTPLQKRNIDTGMGLERLACILQNVDNIFEIDTMQGILKKISEIAQIPYGSDDKKDVSLRIICDHIRSTTFLVSDGVLPSNEGRGYVLRRLLRRAARHGKLLGIDKLFLSDLAEIVIAQNAVAYPELQEKKTTILQIISEEEKRFHKTIDGGLKILAELLKSAKLVATEVFKLYDTYGFPVDLTEEIAADAGITIDRAAFDELMQEQRKRAREARAALGDAAWGNSDLLALLANIKTIFTGYDALTQEAKVVYVHTEDENTTVFLDKEPFYPEQGGQVSDKGQITKGDGTRFVVEAAKKVQGDKIALYGLMESGSLQVGDTVTASVDKKHRMNVSRAHTATHILQAALKEVLGETVNQAGSYVSANMLRFDFSHFAAVSESQLLNVEAICNDIILQALPVTAKEMPIAEAKKLSATALFGEKYGDIVRVVQVEGKSCELCGGTHVDNTGRIGLLKIVSEGSVSAGVRRIEALVGPAVLELLHEKEGRLTALAEQLKTTPAELPRRVSDLQQERKTLQSELDKIQSKEANNSLGDILASAKEIGGVKLCVHTLKGMQIEAVRGLGDKLSDAEKSVVAVLANVSDDKLTFFAVCGKDAVAQGANAGTIVREVAKVTGGSGGGKPGSAMAGGKDIGKMDEALAAAESIVTAMLA